MQKSAKQFSDLLNKNLTDIGVPLDIKERLPILCKILDIPRQQARSLLEGHALPDEKLAKVMETELEMDISSLIRGFKL